MEQNYGKILSAFKENFRAGSNGDRVGNIGTPGYPECGDRRWQGQS